MLKLSPGSVFLSAKQTERNLNKNIDKCQTQNVTVARAIGQAWKSNQRDNKKGEVKTKSKYTSEYNKNQQKQKSTNLVH